LQTVNCSNIYSRIRVTGVNSACGFRDSWGRFPQNWTTVNKYASVPVGYGTGTAYVLPMKTGGMAVTHAIYGVGVTAATLKGYGGAASTITAQGIVVDTSHLTGLKSGVALILGEGLVTNALIKGRTSMSASIVIGFQPSAFDIAQAIWNSLAADYDIPDTMGAAVNAAEAPSPEENAIAVEERLATYHGSGLWEGSVDPEVMAGAVWDSDITEMTEEDTMGAYILKKILTTGRFIGLK